MREKETAVFPWNMYIIDVVDHGAAASRTMLVVVS